MNRSQIPLKLSLLAFSLALAACNRSVVVSDAPVVEQPDGTLVSQPAQPLPPPSAPTGAGSYIVQKGDTLYRIAVSRGLDYRQVAAWNGIAPPYSISPGQVLNLGPSTGGMVSQPVIAAPQPTLPAPAPATTTPRRIEVDFTNGYPTTTTAPAAPSAPATRAPSGGVHVVQRGETLSKIARQYGTTYQQLAALNGIPAPYSLSVGQQLRVPSAGYSSAGFSASGFRATPVSAQPNAACYVVQPGDTIETIALRHSQPTQNLIYWNRLAPPYQLYPGQTLLIRR